MFGRRRLKAEIERLTYRVKELEEQLCPCSQHDWITVSEETEFHAHDMMLVRTHRKCKKCKKEVERIEWR